MSFQDPWWFVALAVPVIVAWRRRRMRPPALRFPTTAELEPAARQSPRGWRRVPTWLRVLALALVVIALARPQEGLEQTRVTAEGIEIVLAVDVSTSMLAEDFQVDGKRMNRLEVVKRVLRDFIKRRPNDKIGLVVFAGRPYTQSPLTLDHGWLLQQLDDAQIGMIEDGTAIGSGIAAGLNRLRASKANSRLMIVLTDGANNAGTITPDAAAELAASLGVKVYTIGAGTTGAAPYPTTDVFGRRVYQPVRIDVDDAGLERIAKTTGGRYFRATDTASLERTYAEIDRMERTTFEQPKFLIYKEQYMWLLIPALMALLIEWVAAHTVLRTVP